MESQTMDAAEPEVPKTEPVSKETDEKPEKIEEAEQPKVEAAQEEPAEGPALSEHESHDEGSRKSQDGSSEGSHSESEDGSVILEREEGDGQESTPNRKVDDDEDKRNPQYIPKRGTFYEHDDRTATAEGSEEPEIPENEKTDKDPAKKKIWSEKESSRWSHDRYNDTEQAPKSRSELVSIYGYDIRNEDGPPRARRRRRYGRGPNKYTRNWEDEDAYGKMQPPVPVRGGGVRKNKRRSKGEDFPPLERDQSKSSERPRSSNSGDSEQNKQNLSGTSGESSTTPKKDETSQPEPSVNKTLPRKPEAPRLENGEHKVQRPPLQRKERTIPKSTPKKPEDFRGASNVRGVTRTRGFRGGRASEQQSRRQRPQQDEARGDFIVSQNFTNKNHGGPSVQELEKDVANMSMQEGGYRGGKFSGQRQASVPPRLQAEQRGSKRYSSLRQRSLPETVPQQQQQQQTFGQHGNFYQNDYNQQTPAPQNQQQGLLPLPTPPIHGGQVPATSAQPIMTVAAPTAQPLGPPPPPANGAPPPLLQGPPPQFGAAYPQAPPAFIQAGVAPPPFIAQQAPPQIINYAQPQFTQPGYSNFQHQQFNPVNQATPAELYQSQGGITYYSTQNQQILPRIHPKRPKAAIPIVPPPEHKEPRGRGRLNQTSEQSVGIMADSQEGYAAEGYLAEAPVPESNGMTQYATEGPVTVEQ